MTRKRKMLWSWGVILSLLLVSGLTLISAEKSPWTTQDKAYYADPNTVAFVRPGLEIAILGAEIAPDGTITARIRFTDPQGLPLDREGVFTPGAISASLIAATIRDGETQYTAYTTRVQDSSMTGNSAIQASSDSGGTWQKVADGEYVYTFGTRAPSDIDRSATHTIGVYANRNLEEFELGVNLKSVNYDFVPDGSPVMVTRDVISTQSCNKCHDSLSAHGTTGRSSMENCILCHSPQTVDPDSGNTVDMAVMIHKIHMGSELPSVQDGTPYVIYGFGGNAHDYSEVKFSTQNNRCVACHEPDTGAVQHDAWLRNPTRASCGSCHDNVNFSTGENHAGGLPQPSDALCANCHIPEGELEFDASIIGAHTIPTESKQLPGLVIEFEEVTNGTAGQRPTVTFSVRDNAGDPIDASGLDRLRLSLIGSTKDYTNTLIQEDVDSPDGSGNGRYWWTFEDPIPADATGSWAISVESRQDVTLNPGTVQAMEVREAAMNPVIYFSVDGSEVEPRRTIVDREKCNSCHGNLSFHGDNRKSIEYCVMCHRPDADDAIVRPEDQLPAESIDLRTMIHRIHSGADLGREYIIYGFRGSVNDYSNVHYPGMLNNCSACHVNNSQQVPLGEDLLNVTDPRGFLNPVGPEAAACLSCHSSLPAASHALANTTALGESCAACHGTDKTASVDKVHAR